MKAPQLPKTALAAKTPSPSKEALPTLRDSILKHFQTLKIRVTAEQLDSLMRESTEGNYSAWQLLERFLAPPAHASRQSSIERRLRLATFPTSATLESFDWSFNAATIPQAPFLELATGEFIRRRDNVNFVGKSGLGKSHLIQAVGRACCAAGYNVKYVTSAGLLEDLTAAAGDKTLSTRVKYYRSFDLLIIDEFGFDKLERREYPESPSLLYKVIDSRSGRNSTALLTNVDFKEWTDYLGDAPLVMAMLDRVVDSATIIPFDGKSYREHRAELKKAEAKLKRNPTS